MPATLWDFTAAITAGGRSSRFGSDKALALWRGRTLLQHVAASLEPCPQRLLVAPPGRYVLGGWTPVEDTRPGEGPLAGLEAALQAAGTGWVAFAGVDLPGLTRTYWETLAAARVPGALSVQAQDVSGRPQPLGALYHTSLLPRLRALLDSGERRLRLAAPEDTTVTAAGLNPAALRNVNTPADLAELKL
ncbi:molybdenum cofactor guanylyltransferase [Deinococcus deserti]|uniref:Probable molybdenum cofactor guanylyltransferase n=1 Tax=Deinococcus deserti (strain DSM 17065 / CIP 109153 / LMG 22923 / VCD115) TaxID=546414 RepID=C1CYV9_DEIDV|nr:molybdenum cofactor guanylyltransferase [Deinococcus deserti]ACO47139.1 putative molybdopterin-guanine dinucleotide biosynthesis protein A [Deinococcus deserti VCD115]